MEPQQLTNGLQWLGTAALAIIIALIGALALGVYNRYFGKKDKADELHESNIASRFEADADFRHDVLARVKEVESELKEMQKEQLLQVRRDERFTAKNEYLEKENERQGGEILDLRTRNRDLTAKVNDLTAHVVRLEANLAELIGHPIEVKLVDGDK